MISPLPNNNIRLPKEVLPTIDNDIRCTSLPPSNVVSFGPLHNDMQQTDHFEREYQYLILQSIPPLIRYQPPMPSRVGVIPSSIKRSPLIPAIHETTTLTHNLEPTNPTEENNMSVFSGPHFLPEKYSIKPIAAFRQSYFVPTYKDDTPSRYYATPHIQHYFRAALQDGSYFETYSDYSADDPVNFRHAYNLSQPSNSLDSHEKEKSTTHSESTTTKSNLDSNRYNHLNQPLHRPVYRNAYRPISTRSILLNRSDSTTRRPDPQPSTSTRFTYSSPSAFDSIPYETSRQESSLTESSSDFMPYEEPSLPPARKWHKPVSISSESTSEDDSDVSANITTNRNKGKQPESAGSTPKRKIAVHSPSPEIIKKRKISSDIPTKTEAIEELRQLGKFTKLWTQKDAEVCCVCFEDVTTQSNPLVYCDNALCEVIVHKNCYKIKSNIANSEHWYCDRCRPSNGVSVYRNVTCVLCPNVTGAFCKLSESFYGIEWVHMICAKNLTGPSGFTYQPKTHDYRMSIRNHIPIQRFLDACMYCTDPMFAQFGAKLKCRFCPQLFHVTCAGKNGYWCFNKDAVLACAEHAIVTSTKSSPRRLALAFEKWISKRDVHLLDQFNITHTGIQIETWKRAVKKSPFIPENDLMDQSFKLFFDRIKCHTVDHAKKKYMEFVDFLLNEFCRSYSSSYILKVNGLFLKKNFYHSPVYRYVPPKGAFSICEDTEPLKKKAEKSSGSEATPKLTLYANPPRSSFTVSTNNKKTSNDPKLTANSQQQQQQPTTASPKLKRSEEQPIVVPSPDLICFICGQHEFPKATWDSFAFTEDYVEHLKATSHQRKVGHTGTGNFWDPRVFIQCAECHLKVHCGCPNPPIKKYPQKFQSFVCIHCDTKGEEVSLKNDFHRRRGTTGINYKV